MKINYEDIMFNVEVKGEGLPIVFLHGFSENISTFQYLDCKGYRKIFIDIIGHGKTQSPEDMKYYNINYLVKAINFIINSITNTKYILYGYSMGGRISLAYALTYQEELIWLILESASYGIEDKSLRSKRYYDDCRLAEEIRNKGIKWFESYWSNITIFQSQKNLEKKVQDNIREIRLSNNIVGLTNSLIGFSQGRINCFKSKLYKLNINTTYISGESDEKYTSIGKKFIELLENVNHIIVKSCGHNVHMEKPYRVNELLQNIKEKINEYTEVSYE